MCYRHPERTSYIRCQRCSRAVCLDCQTQAPVGVICPECIQEARAKAPRVTQAARALGAPVVTYSLIAITVFVYVLQWIPGLNVTEAIQYGPRYSYGELADYGLYEPWRMMTSVFAHDPTSIFHILFNMYTLFIFGRVLEQQLGRGRFLTLYLLSGLAGSLGVMYWADLSTLVVGASGAIFGLLGAFVVIQRKLGGEIRGLFILIAINLVIGFFPGMSIAWQAHLGGLIAGALIGFILVQTRKPAQRKLQTGLIWLVFGGMMALVLLHAPMFV